MSTKEIHVNFNYQNQYTKEITQTIPSPLQYKTLQESYHKTSKLYQPQTFKSLKLQSKQNVPSANISNINNINNLNDANNTNNTNSATSVQPPLLNSSPKVFKQKYNIPVGVCQSLHEQQQLLDELIPPCNENQGQIPLLQGGKDESLQSYKKSKEQNRQYKIVQLPQQKQSEFKGCCGLGTTNDKISFRNKPEKPQKKKQQNPEQLKQSSNNVELLKSGKKESQRKTLNKARGEVKTFVIDKLPQQKQSDFGGCCGFRTSKKVAYESK